MAETARAAGFDRVIRFRHGRNLDRTCRASTASMNAPRNARSQACGLRRADDGRSHTIAAGGGSILHYDGARFRVRARFGGRQSGTDELSARRPAHRDRRNVARGKVRKNRFPRIFRCAGEIRRSTTDCVRAGIRTSRTRQRTAPPKTWPTGSSASPWRTWRNAIQTDIGRSRS